MTSEKQIEANRRNARRSTGPKTDRGKAIVARNALRHGLTAERILLPDETPQDLSRLADQLRLHFRPVGECCSLDVSYFRRKGMLTEGQAYSTRLWWKDEHGHEVASLGAVASAEAVVLFCTITRASGGRDPEDICYTVPVVWTPCNYGGQRPWFLCPGRDCEGRVSKLYLPVYSNAKYYLCRHCYDLAYASQRKDKSGRLLQKAWDIRERLGGNPGVQYPFPPRPKRMRWWTYWRLRLKHDRALDKALAGMVAESHAAVQRAMAMANKRRRG